MKSIFLLCSLFASFIFSSNARFLWARQEDELDNLRTIRSPNKLRHEIEGISRRLLEDEEPDSLEANNAEAGNADVKDDNGENNDDNEKVDQDENSGDNTPEQDTNAVDNPEGDADETNESAEGSGEGGDESAEIDEENSSEDPDTPPQTNFKNTDHTDLYTVKRERDRAWEMAKRKGGVQEKTSIVPKRPVAATKYIRKTPNAENGKWVEKNGAYVFVSTRGCVNDTCPYTVADDNLKAALDLPSNANDAELLASVMNPNRWKRNSDQAYRERVCRGSKHDMPRWCKGSAGPGGKYARELDEAEKSWIEQAGRRQESKQTLLVNHKAYLKEAKIQKESMEYTKKALEAQEAVDEATKLALQRVKMEAEVLKQVEQDEADAWHDLVEIRQKVVKYRTLSKDQITQMEKEEREDEKTKEREQRSRERTERAKERAQMEAQQKAKALMVERAKMKARQAQKELERALSIASKGGEA
mmetsp:Transcript_20449/g.28331  ORF Transcript_20449/g.28331 Transcript_20449/m.28331 type:complete len:474 (+) Transcript_20449:137-1558(+)